MMMMSVLIRLACAPLMRTREMTAASRPESRFAERPYVRLYIPHLRPSASNPLLPRPSPVLPGRGCRSVFGALTGPTRYRNQNKS